MGEMKYWPDYTTPNEKSYTLKHVKMLEVTLDFCKQFRTAVQAGGSIGYWPRRMAEVFKRVITFEPEPTMNWCLTHNLAKYKNVEVRNEALGPYHGKVGIQLSGFGSHYITSGNNITMIPLDQLCLDDVDLIQLDVEGYESQALEGSTATVNRCRPIIQVEILKPEVAYSLETFFEQHRYKQIHKFPRDYVYAPIE